jgi:hypothetical protein
MRTHLVGRCVVALCWCEIVQLYKGLKGRLGRQQQHWQLGLPEGVLHKLLQDQHSTPVDRTLQVLADRMLCTMPSPCSRLHDSCSHHSALFPWCR